MLLLVGWLVGRSNAESALSVASPVAPAAAGTGEAPSAIDEALRAAVQVIIPAASGRSAAMGSGTIVSSEGHILTNFHVVGDEETGRLFDASGLALIAMPLHGSSSVPEIRFQAEVIGRDLQNDLALLRIVSLADGRRLSADFGLTPIRLGDSASVHIGDTLTILGYPDVGGGTVTLTRGSVAGFLPDERWIKTDAEVNPGNSGGTAIDEAGAFVGIPTAVHTGDESAPGKLGLVRPLAEAIPLLEQAGILVGG